MILLIFSYQHQLPRESERVTDAEKPRGFGEKGESRQQTPNLEQISAKKNTHKKLKKIGKRINQSKHIRKEI